MSVELSASVNKPNLTASREHALLDRVAFAAIQSPINDSEVIDLFGKAPQDIERGIGRAVEVNEDLVGKGFGQRDTLETDLKSSAA